MDELAPKAVELLGFHIPSSNFYPIGAGLLYAPFVALGLGPSAAILFYLNIGLIFYYLITLAISSFAWRLVALIGLAGNIVFLTVIQWGEDTVLQFACLSVAFYFLLKARPLAFGGLALLAASVRSTDFVMFLVIAVLMSVLTRSKRWLLFPVLFALLCLFNWAQYGSPAPSLNSGVNVFIGQQPLYPIGHPKFDIDVFFNLHGFLDPDKVLPASKKRSEVEIDRSYQEMGMKSLFRDIPRFAYSSIMKANNWVLNDEEVPSAPGSYSLERDGAGRYRINIDEMPASQAYVFRSVYMLYKLIYNSLFLMAVAAVLLLAWRCRHLDPMAMLLFTTLMTLPIVVLAFPDTRFKINYEIFALPAMAVYAPRFLQAIVAGFPRRQEAVG